ncbi:MAG: TonB-dependent receptor [Ignavibacteria bacterium]|nr:TonB-dependent receptor [Ignavibacteria bacterium]
MHRRTPLVSTAFLLLLLVISARAQQPTGSIHGTVIDATTREPLIGANVIVVGTAFGRAAGIDGSYTIENIPAGTYRVQASVIGYTSMIETDVVVASGRRTTADFALTASTIDLDAVTVEAEYFRRNMDAPVSSQALSYEEIRRSPGGLEDVVRAIAVLPGVVQASGGRNDLIVRGGAPSENLYVIDNLEVPNINHFGTQGATGGPLSFVNLDFVRDITFSTGGFGARYGDKLSSVLNIQLKDGREDRIGGKATISASQFGLNTEGPIGESGSFLFSARRSYLDFIFKAAGFGFVPEYWDFLGKATVALDRNNELSFLAIGALDDIRFFNDTEDKRYDNSRILGSSQDQYVSSVSWRHLIRDGFFTVSLGRSFVTYDYLQSDSLLRPLFTSASKERETSLRADAVILLDRSYELSFGAQAKLLRTGGTLFVAPNPYFPLPSLPDRDWDTTGAKVSAYAQLAHTFFDRLQATIGGRLDYFGMIDKPLAAGPRASLSYLLSPLTSVSVSGGIYHQAPAAIWLVSNPANAALSHLRVTQVVAGIEHLFRADTKVRVEGYLKRYTNYPANTLRPWLVMANTGAGFGGSVDGYAAFGFDPLASEGTGNARGVELLVQKRLSEIPCYGILSLSYGRTDFTALDGVSRPGSFDQRLIFNLSGGYRFNDKWEISTKFRLGTGTPWTPFLASGVQDVARYNSERTPLFHTLDVRVDRRWNFASWNLITYIDLQNVYNRKNVQSYRFDYRNARTIEDGGAIGLLPTIGISAEF